MSCDEAVFIMISVERSCGANKIYYEDCIWDMYTDLKYGCIRSSDCRCIENFFEKDGKCFPNPTTPSAPLSSRDFNMFVRSNCT
ncbi:unnamed protein product [Dracunculus medinensis]|uniref:EB domain-containing protein n=1 Tax=Dracunculus medinensis TaxID=318479 RepID=A0A0N4UDE2_DRAME|nr:unnamed protein product [Dracunculus medinensis]